MQRLRSSLLWLGLLIIASPAELLARDPFTAFQQANAAETDDALSLTPVAETRSHRAILASEQSGDLEPPTDTFAEPELPPPLYSHPSDGLTSGWRGCFPSPPTPGYQSCQEWDWHVMPQGIIYHAPLAAPKESRLGTQWDYDSHNKQWWFDNWLGGRFGLLRFGPEDYPEGFQFDIEGSGQVRLAPQNEMDVQATDYRVGLPLTYGFGPHRFRFGYYHISSHLGDEFLIKNPGYNRLNFYRDALLLGYSYYATPDLRLYFEGSYAVHREIAGHVEFSFGVDWAPGTPTGRRGAPFLALNGYIREELNYGGSFSMQTGWAWRGNSPASGLFRAGLFYHNGASLQWSLYQQYEQMTGFGCWYDF